MSNIRYFPKKKQEERKTVKVKDIECLALLTNRDEEFYIDDPASIARVVAFMQQNGIKWKM